jgi:hypothetical protein
MKDLRIVHLFHNHMHTNSHSEGCVLLLHSYLHIQSRKNLCLDIHLIGAPVPYGRNSEAEGNASPGQISVTRRPEQMERVIRRDATVLVRVVLMQIGFPHSSVEYVPRNGAEKLVHHRIVAAHLHKACRPG